MDISIANNHHYQIHHQESSTESLDFDPKIPIPDTKKGLQNAVQTLLAALENVISTEDTLTFDQLRLTDNPPTYYSKKSDSSSTCSNSSSYLNLPQPPRNLKRYIEDDDEDYRDSRKSLKVSIHLSSKLNHLHVDDEEDDDMTMNVDEASGLRDSGVDIYENSKTPKNSPPLPSISTIQSDNDVSQHTLFILKQKAAAQGITLDEAFLKNWICKRNEIVTNLMLIQNEVDGLSNWGFEDLKVVCRRILETGRWLGLGDLDGLAGMVNLWGHMEPKINSLITYIQQIEEIQATIQPSTSHSSLQNHHHQVPLNQTQNFDMYFDKLNHLLHQQKTRFTNLTILESNWKNNFFPMDHDVLNGFRGWISGLAWLGLVKAESMINEKEDFKRNISIALEFSNECTMFNGTTIPPPVRIIHASLTLASIHIQDTIRNLEKLPVKSNNAKLVTMYEETIKIVSTLKYVILDRESEDEDRIIRLLTEVGLRLFLKTNDNAKAVNVGGKSRFLLMGLGCKFLNACIGLLKGEYLMESVRLRRLTRTLKM